MLWHVLIYTTGTHWVLLLLLTMGSRELTSLWYNLFLFVDLSPGPRLCCRFRNLHCEWINAKMNTYFQKRRENQVVIVHTNEVDTRSIRVPKHTSRATLNNCTFNTNNGRDFAKFSIEIVQETWMSRIQNWFHDPLLTPTRHEGGGRSSNKRRRRRRTPVSRGGRSE